MNNDKGEGGCPRSIPLKDVVNEDDKLLMWYNIAQRLGGR